MTKRIFKYICLVSLAVFLACLLLIMGVLYEYFTAIIKDQLRSQTELAAQGAAADGLDFLSGLEGTDYRITWVSDSGQVLFDSAAEPVAMENHADREEIREALESGWGESSRYSETLTRRQLYCARRLPDGSVIRLSATQNTALSLMLSMGQSFLVIFAVAAALSLFFAARLSKRIIKPLNSLNLDEPLKNTGYDELSPLLRRIDSQHRQITAQLAQLKQKQDEFDAVTDNMSEGLVLLDAKGAILSINPSAARILGADKSCVGQDMLSLNRAPFMQELLSGAAKGSRTEREAELSGRDYQLDASPVLSGDTVSGTALLLFDITEKAGAQQLRREFTANVSHELKTPLHSISGCAELLLGGLVKPGDEAQFTRQIYSEVQRMIRLVDDIIHLSSLDEGGGEGQKAPCDLYLIAGEALKALQSEAEKSCVSLSLNGECAEISAVPQLVRGIVFNLCDNAVKYNRSGGSVSVSVKKTATTVLLEVSDTGIGIAPEQQGRIFERFYRVDKSHSKETGGTGLGLSIVKHSARLLGADIELKSTPGEGSSFFVSFPLA